MLATDERIRIEQRPSDQVHGRDYPNEPAERAPCRYCGRPTVENLSFSAVAKRRLGRCHACLWLLRGQPDPLEAEFWPAKRPPKKPRTKGNDE